MDDDKLKRVHDGLSSRNTAGYVRADLEDMSKEDAKRLLDYYHDNSLHHSSRDEDVANIDASAEKAHKAYLGMEQFSRSCFSEDKVDGKHAHPLGLVSQVIEEGLKDQQGILPLVANNLLNKSCSELTLPDLTGTPLTSSFYGEVPTPFVTELHKALFAKFPEWYYSPSTVQGLKEEDLTVVVGMLFLENPSLWELDGSSSFNQQPSQVKWFLWRRRQNQLVYGSLINCAYNTDLMFHTFQHLLSFFLKGFSAVKDQVALVVPPTSTGTSQERYLHLQYNNTLVQILRAWEWEDVGEGKTGVRLRLTDMKWLEMGGMNTTCNPLLNVLYHACFKYPAREDNLLCNLSFHQFLNRFKGSSFLLHTLVSCKDKRLARIKAGVLTRANARIREDGQREETVNFILEHTDTTWQQQYYNMMNSLIEIRGENGTVVSSMKLEQFCRLWKDTCVHRAENQESDDGSGAGADMERPDGFHVDPTTLSVYAGSSAMVPMSHLGVYRDERFNILRRNERFNFYPNGLDQSSLVVTNGAVMQEAIDFVGAQTFTVWTLPQSLSGLAAQERNQLAMWLEMQLIEKILAPFGNCLNSRVTAGVGLWRKTDFPGVTVRPIVYLTVCTKFLQRIKEGKATLSLSSFPVDRLINERNDEASILIASGFDGDKAKYTDLHDKILEDFESRQVKIELSRQHSDGYSLSLTQDKYDE